MVTVMTVNMTTLLVLFLVLATAYTEDTDEESLLAEMECEADGNCQEKAASDSKQQLNDLPCGVYMAPSTLGETTNMGIYTGIPLKKDDVVNFPEIVIPLLFREWGDHTTGFDDGMLWDRYIWEGDVMDIESYTDTNRDDTRAVLVPGVGCTVNSVLDMSNIESTHGSIYDTTNLHRSKDPGVTAFTPYHGAETTVTAENIAAGSELFAGYGDYWIPDIPRVQVTMNDKMDAAEEFLREKYMPWVKDHSHLHKNLHEALYELVKEYSIANQDLSNLPRVSFDKVKEFYDKHPDYNEDDDNDKNDHSIIRHFIRQQSIRPIRWLQEHGYCQDHLRPATSTIPQAGRGAFAVRDLPKGAVVGYSPLVHIGEYGHSVMAVPEDDKNNNTKKSKYDLMINYSFGHRNSTMLLTPYGGMVQYINHNSKAPNVRLQWPKKELVAHKPTWLDQPPSVLRDTIDKIGLSLEYVALRDIKEGEEVVMDYGPEWEKAWKKYVADWKPPSDAGKYVHSTQFELDGGVYRTAKELEGNPYPPNLVTMCEESFSQVGDNYVWTPVLRSLSTRIYCNVLDRDEGDDGTTYYTVEMVLQSGEKVQVQDVPHEQVYLYDRAFSQDWHLKGAFRHFIAIPDDIMPQAWLNGPGSIDNRKQQFV